MRTITVSKVSIRKLTNRERLPPKFSLFIPGCWLLDVLRENGMEKKQLLSETYWVKCKSKSSTQLTLSY